MSNIETVIEEVGFNAPLCAKETKGALIWGIIALVCSGTLPPLGVIFGIIALKKSKHARYEFEYGWSKGQSVKARLGKIFGLVGIVLGAIYTLVCVANMIH